MKTVKSYLGIEINHVILVNFEKFPQLIDAMGGIDYTGGCVVSRINGGFRNGGYTLRLQAGTTHIDGRQALALVADADERCATARERPHPRAPPAEDHRRDALAVLSPRVRPLAADRLAAPQTITSDMGAVGLRASATIATSGNASRGC